MVGSGSRSHDLHEDNMICFLTSAIVLRIYLWRDSIYNVWNMTMESITDKANAVFKMIRKTVTQ